MPTFLIELKKGSQIHTLRNFLSEKYGDVFVDVRRDDPPESRADRLSIVSSNIENEKSEVEQLKDELQQWYDNLPENFQNGQKGDELQESISQLEEIESSIDEIVSVCESISFPSMF